MPIRVYYENQPCAIRPTPLVSISQNILKNGAGNPFGATYTITLTGTLIADQGTPYAINQGGSPYEFCTAQDITFVGPYGAFDNNISHFENNRPPQQRINSIQASHAIFAKQKALRALFSKDGQKLELYVIHEELAK